MRTSLGIIIAVVLHAAFLLFGGLLFLHSEKDKAGHIVEVQLDADGPLKEDDKKKDEKKEDKAKDQKQETETVENPTERPPDAEEMVRTLELAALHNAPALEAASLGQIEAALSGAGGAGGDFGFGMTFESGGRIGGVGKGPAAEEKVEEAFSMTEIDQKPRCVFQSPPVYPSEMRDRKLDGVVTVLFVVDPTGRVTSQKVEKSFHPAFDKPALDAVRQWKFEPAVKGGQRVACKMRVPIRFQRD